MIDWTKSMQQTYEYYEVDPGTWKDVRPINTITSANIKKDSEAETLGSASFDTTETLGEMYVRTYLRAIQNGVKYRFPLGTHLVQSPNDNFDGKKHSYSLDGYTSLIELKENRPPLGYTLLKNTNIMDQAYKLTKENLRAPVSKPENDKTLYSNFTSNTGDTWMSFLLDLVRSGEYEFGLDELGGVLFLPMKDIASLQPVTTFDTSNSSILYPEIKVNRDIYSIPNVLEVIYSKNNGHYYAKAVNDDPNSPTSTVNRGRTIVTRETDPDLNGAASQSYVQQYAERRLRQLSSLEYRVSFSHGYYPVRLGDAVRLDYPQAGIHNMKAKVISQNIKCEPGCKVETEAVFTQKLWG